MGILYKIPTITLFYFVTTSLLNPVYSFGQTFSEVQMELIGVAVSQNRNAWGDFDNDGDLDLLLTGDFNDLTQSFAVTRIYRNDAGNFQPVSMILPDVTLSAANWCDFDNDGDLDILLSGVSPSGRMAAIYRNDGGDFVDINAPLVGLSRTSLDWGDFDNDGDMDIAMIGLVSATEALSSIYRNENGNFVRMSGVFPDVFLGTVSWVDFDNDADVDIFLAAGEIQNFDINPITAIYKNESGILTRLDFPFQAMAGGPAAWGDFDNDGDLDVIATGASEFGLFSKVYENLRNGFRDKETSLANVWGGAAAWGDVDNDGDLDIVLTGSLENNRFVSQVLRNDDGDFTLMPDEPLIPVTSTSSSVFGDYDNDGDLDLLLTGTGSPDGSIANEIGSVTRLYQNNSPNKNSAPNPPTRLQARVEADRVFLQWDRAIDAETPQLGLSYNLRVGTDPGGVNIMSPMADVASGYRKVAAIGNAFQNTQWFLRSLPQGTYYWSVQAIDHSFAGSAFAEEQTFTIETQPIEFSLKQNYPNPFNTSTSFEFKILQDGHVQFHIYNLLGEVVATLVDGWLSTGRYQKRWDANGLASGVYLYRLKAVGFTDTKTLTLLR